jgi:hypothetical protein
MKSLVAAFAALFVVIGPGRAFASCGSAFCTLNTNWDVQGPEAAEPGLRADLRYEYIRQDQPMSGSRKVSVGEIPRDHDELLTTNRNWLPSLDYGGRDWGVNLLFPFVDRHHEHLHNDPGGAQELETWNFKEVGDMRILGRRRLATFGEDGHSPSTVGVNLGVKLPTGDTQIVNAEGERAERTLQPGSGTTDLLVGAYYMQHFHASDFAWFAQALAQLPLNSSEDYRPGRRFTTDVGLRYAVSEKASLMLQANFLYKNRDSGAQAEPDDSGGKFLYLSPGASYAITDKVQLYGFVQMPVYQYVNGVQLTASRAIALGITARF